MEKNIIKTKHINDADEYEYMFTLYVDETFVAKNYYRTENESNFEFIDVSDEDFAKDAESKYIVIRFTDYVENFIKSQNSNITNVILVPRATDFYYLYVCSTIFDEDEIIRLVEKLYDSEPFKYSMIRREDEMQDDYYCTKYNVEYEISEIEYIEMKKLDKWHMKIK